jgi:putative hydrolase of the HAD superfamily
MIDLKNIKNLIFDLGGVILDIDIERTIRGFRNAGMQHIFPEEIMFSSHPFFEKYETGMISSDVFRNELRRITLNHLIDDEIDAIWNALIVGFEPAKIELLKKLKTKYRTFLLSNTNAIHEVAYNKILKETTGVENLRLLFEDIFYSHIIHLRKPDPEIFKYILNQTGLVPEETLFIDDLEINLNSAARFGIRTYHLSGQDSILKIFN